MNLEESIKKLINTGSSVLSIPVITEADSELFLTGLDKYLEMLDTLQPSLKLESQNIPQELGKQLLDIHQQVTKRAEQEKEGVLVKMSQLNQRANILRTYVNQMPSRISITGKREG